MLINVAGSGKNSYTWVGHTYSGERVTAVWYGGEYITLFDKLATAYDVINVWDYEASKPNIVESYEAFVEAILATLNDHNDPRNFPADYRSNPLTRTQDPSIITHINHQNQEQRSHR